MNSDNYDMLLADIAFIKEQLFKQSKTLNSIENDVKLLLMSNSDVKNDDVKDDKIPMMHLVDKLPNDKLLDEFEHTEGTYKDYSRMTHDTLSDEEIKSFEAGQKGEVYEPEPMCKCPKYADEDEVEICPRKSGLSSAVDRWPTDEELDKIEAEELKAYKKHFTEVL